MGKTIFTRIGALLVPFLFMGSTAMAAHFTPVTSNIEAGNLATMTVTIPAALAANLNIGGNLLKAGDEIAVYSPNSSATAKDSQCAGSVAWASSGALEIIVSGQKVAQSTGPLSPNDLLVFYVWDSANNKTVPAIVTYTDAAITGKFVPDQKPIIKSLVPQYAPSQLALTSPLDGAIWGIGIYDTIKWTPKTGLTPIQIDYTLDNGAMWKPITTITNNTGSFAWKIPNVILASPAIAGNCKIRIARTNAPTDLGSFNINPFTISANIKVSAPQTNAVVIAESTIPITYSPNGNIDKVVIEYTYDNSTWIAIAGSPFTITNGNAINQNWKLPTASSKICKVRVYKSLAVGVTTIPNGYPADTTGNFIVAPSIALTKPTAGEHLIGNTIYKINWSSLITSGKIKIEYSTNASAATPTWTTIVKNAPGTGTFDWTVPNTPTSANQTNCKVRLIDSVINEPTPTPTSNTFVIEPSPTISITAPNNSEAWGVGSKQNITWTSTGTIANVKVEFRKSANVAWRTLAASVANTTNNKTYSWTIPDTLSDSCKVRISDASNALVFDTNNTRFSIVAAKLSLKWPTANNLQLSTAKAQTITWDSTGVIGAVKVQLSVNDAAWTTIIASTPNTGKYAWTIPDSAAYISPKCKIRLSAVSGSAHDSSANYFAIVSGAAATIALTAPNDKLTWFTGTPMPITWTSTGTFDSVKIEYALVDTAWKVITLATANKAGTYTWNIPDSITPSTTCNVRITGITTNKPMDVSANDFVLVAPKITLVSPNGGEAWNAKTVNTISWTSDSVVGKVKIEYTSNNGKAWKILADSATNNKGGSFAWTPDSTSDSCKVRVSAAKRLSVSDVGKIFSIIPAPSIIVVTPKNLQKYVGGDTMDVVWSSNDVTGKVKIEYSNNNGTTWTLIKDSVNATASYSWIISKTEKASDSCKIRVSSYTFSSSIGVSDGMFSIKAPVSISTRMLLGCMLKADITTNRAGMVIHVGVPQAAPVDIRIFNVMGKEVARVQNSLMATGYHNIAISTAQLKSGYYIANVKIGSTQFNKVVSYTK